MMMPKSQSVSKYSIDIFRVVKFIFKLEMLARLSAGHRDGHRRQADDDFRGWVKTLVLFLTVSRPKFLKSWHDVGDPLQFSTPFPDYLYQVLHRKYSHSKLPLSCQVVKNRSKIFGPPIFAGRGPQNFYGSLLPWFTPYRVAKFGLSLPSFLGDDI